MRWFLQILSVIALWFGLANSANAIVIDLSQRNIEIRYSFDGADLILFGSIGDTPIETSADDYDVVIVVRGPESPAVVRRKAKAAGVMWVNRDNLTFPAAPGYYAVAANRQLKDIATPVAYAQSGIGFENLRLATDGKPGAEQQQAEFQQALYRIRSDAGLYRQEVDTVTILREGLFRTDIRLPANVPVGEFNVDAYVFKGGELMARDRIPLEVDKAGFERAVYNFAHSSPFLYGLMAVLIALGAGWLAGILGKK